MGLLWELSKIPPGFIDHVESQRERWSRIFRLLDGANTGHDPWLERWVDLLEDGEGAILDLGCGAGHDSRFLAERGFPVVAADFSGEALRLTRHAAPEAETKRFDMTLGLPFSDSEFRAVVASLCLHYFPWDETVRIADEIRRCLEMGGHLFARFNSTNDQFHANAEKKEIEASFYFVGGTPKRLFDREGIEALFGEGWGIVGIEERATGRFGRAKTLWEVVVEKKPENST